MHLALLDAPAGSPGLVELVEAAVEHYALNYSKHPAQVLFDEVHSVRGLLASVLAAPATMSATPELRRAAGWLSALLGNLASTSPTSPVHAPTSPWPPHSAIAPAIPG